MAEQDPREQATGHQADVQGDVSGQVAVGEHITQTQQSTHFHIAGVYVQVPFPSLRERFARLTLVGRVLMLVGAGVGLALVAVVTLGALPSLIQDAQQPGGILPPLLPAPTVAPTPLPPMPSSGFNIAVAQFTPLDEDADDALAQASQDLSQWLYRFMQRKADDLPASLAPSLRGPDHIEPIPGADRAARAAKADEVARDLNATILIYGVVSAGADGYAVQPEFYVSEQGFSYGSEVTGPNRLGQAVPFSPPLGEARTLHQVNLELEVRAEALADLVRGLAHFYVADYDQAYLEFQAATQVPGWQPEEGQEVAYVMMGAAQLLAADELKAAQQAAAREGRAQEVSAIQEQRRRALEGAVAAFAAAQRLNPDYARSYLGLGAASLQQATNLSPDGTVQAVDPLKLGEAEAWYAGSRGAADQPPLANVGVKADYGLGQIHLVGYEFELDGWAAAEARRYLNQVVSAYDPEGAPEVTWFVGAAHALLGHLDYLEGDWPAMAAECRQAVDILSSISDASARLEAMIAENEARIAWAEEQLNTSD